MKAIGKILILLNALILPHFAVDKKCAAAAVAERDAALKAADSKCKASLEIVKHPRELNSKMHARYMEASKEHNNAEQQLRNAEQDCRKKPQAERDACIKPHQAKRDSAYAQMQRFKKLWDEASEKSGKAEKEAGALQQQCKAEQNTAQDKYREKYKSCIK